MTEEKKSWRDSLASLVVSLLILGPLGIPIIWLNRRINLLMKISLTVLMVFVSAYLVHSWYQINARYLAQREVLPGY